MRNIIIGFIAAVMLLGAESRAAAQTTAPEPAAIDLSTINVQPYVTVRFHAGPNLNLMHDWREGIDSLAGLATTHGLTPHHQCCISKSWGATALVHVMDRVAIGGSYEALRDTREFRVTDTIDAFGFHGDGEFSFENATEISAAQAVVAVYPRLDSHTHLQFGGGFGKGRTIMSTPGSSSSASLRGPIMSVSAGTEARLWYADAGWRYTRLGTGTRTVSDFFMYEARDVFPDVAAVDDFVRGRDTDLTGVWARIGIALHFGHR